MKNSRLLTTLLIFVVAILGILGFQVATNRTPVLGLDLRGGLSVIYATAEPADQEDLIAIRDLMRDQLESFGIAEPDVRVEGQNIIVDLPGVNDQEEAFKALQVSGIVELRPVLSCQVTIPPTSTVPGSTTPGSTTPGSTVPGTTTPGASVDTSVPATTVADSGSDSSSSAAGVAGGSRVARGRAFAGAAPSTTVPGTTVPAVGAAPGTTAPPTSVPTGSTVPGSTVPADSTVPPTTAPVLGPPAPTTTVPVDTSQQKVLPNKDGTEICTLGPPAGTGEVFARKSAKVGIDQNTGGWIITADLRGEGELQWNAIASQCYSGAATCPGTAGGRGRLAIVLDDVIQTAPSVNAPSFSGAVTISGSFTESEARDLAQTINRGAFPVQVVQQRVETVSPTAGDDSFNAAVFAGLVGVGLTLIYMIVYYRKLSIVIIAGIVVWSALVYVLSTFISRESNYAFTIAGATGIIVSIGVTVDTYIVFFERLKDEVRNGRSLRNAGPKAFAATWKTILAANTVALMSAVVLFFLSVGSVRGFALYLAMTTICDVVVFYFFTRPALYLLAGTRWFHNSDPRSLGIGTAIGGAQ